MCIASLIDNGSEVAHQTTECYKGKKKRVVHCKALSYQVLLSCVVWSTAMLVHTPTLASILFFLLMDYGFCIKELEQFLTHCEFESVTVHSGEP